MKNKKIIVTGSSGFIGFHVSKLLLENNYIIMGIDNHNNYYDPKLKNVRKKILNKYKNFKFFKVDIKDKDKLLKIFKNHRPHVTINLAAQAGVRYSFKNPQKYIDSNITGFTNILEIMKFLNLKNLIYASSSSVYGDSKKFPFKENQNLNPLNFYGQTKLMNEKIANIYKKNFNINTIGFRFFTVYGPYGRPDMAYYKFTESILNNKKIDVYNNGDMKRDFTYIDDIVEGIIRVINKTPRPTKNDHSSSKAPYTLYNIGNNNPVSLKSFIKAIENSCKKRAIKNFLPMQPGDVPITYADIDDLIKDIQYKPETPLGEGIKYFVDWYVKTFNKDNAK